MYRSLHKESISITPRCLENVKRKILPLPIIEDSVFKLTYIYVLKCRKNSRYIGLTKNIYERFKSHFTFNCCTFTTKYRPNDIEAIYNSYSLKVLFKELYNISFRTPNDIENFITLFFKTNNSKRGIEYPLKRVSGGCYTTTKDQLIAPPEEIKLLDKIIYCYCGVPCIHNNNEKRLECPKKSLIAFKEVLGIPKESIPCNFHLILENEITVNNEIIIKGKKKIKWNLDEHPLFLFKRYKMDLLRTERIDRYYLESDESKERELINLTR